MAFDYKNLIYARLNVLDVAQSYGVNDIERVGGYYKCPCCFHKENTASLFFYPEDNRSCFRCYGCDARGSLIDFATRFEGSESKAYIKLAEMAGIDLKQTNTILSQINKKPEIKFSSPRNKRISDENEIYVSQEQTISFIGDDGNMYYDIGDGKAILVYFNPSNMKVNNSLESLSEKEKLNVLQNSATASLSASVNGIVKDIIRNQTFNVVAVKKSAFRKCYLQGEINGSPVTFKLRNIILGKGIRTLPKECLKGVTRLEVNDKDFVFPDLNGTGVRTVQIPRDCAKNYFHLLNRLVNGDQRPFTVYIPKEGIPFNDKTTIEINSGENKTPFKVLFRKDKSYNTFGGSVNKILDLLEKEVDKDGDTVVLNVDDVYQAFIEDKNIQCDETLDSSKFAAKIQTTGNKAPEYLKNKKVAKVLHFSKSSEQKYKEFISEILLSFRGIKTSEDQNLFHFEKKPDGSLSSVSIAKEDLKMVLPMMNFQKVLGLLRPNDIGEYSLEAVIEQNYKNILLSEKQVRQTNEFDGRKVIPLTNSLVTALSAATGFNEDVVRRQIEPIGRMDPVLISASYLKDKDGRNFADKYLKERGLSEETIKHFQVGYERRYATPGNDSIYFIGRSVVTLQSETQVWSEEQKAYQYIPSCILARYIGPSADFLINNIANYIKEKDIYFKDNENKYFTIVAEKDEKGSLYLTNKYLEDEEIGLKQLDISYATEFYKLIDDFNKINPKEKYGHSGISLFNAKNSFARKENSEEFVNDTLFITEGEIDAMSVYEAINECGVSATALGLGSVNNRELFLKNYLKELLKPYCGQVKDEDLLKEFSAFKERLKNGEVELIPRAAMNVVVSTDNDSAGKTCKEELLRGTQNKSERVVGLREMARVFQFNCIESLPMSSKDPNGELTNREQFIKKIKEDYTCSKANILTSYDEYGNKFYYYRYENDETCILFHTDVYPDAISVKIPKEVNVLKKGCIKGQNIKNIFIPSDSSRFYNYETLKAKGIIKDGEELTPERATEIILNGDLESKLVFEDNVFSDCPNLKNLVVGVKGNGTQNCSPSSIRFGKNVFEGTSIQTVIISPGDSYIELPNGENSPPTSNEIFCDSETGIFSNVSTLKYLSLGCNEPTNVGNTENARFVFLENDLPQDVFDEYCAKNPEKDFNFSTREELIQNLQELFNSDEFKPYKEKLLAYTSKYRETGVNCEIRFNDIIAGNDSLSIGIKNDGSVRIFDCKVDFTAVEEFVNFGDAQINNDKILTDEGYNQSTSTITFYNSNDEINSIVCASEYIEKERKLLGEIRVTEKESCFVPNVQTNGFLVVCVKANTKINPSIFKLLQPIKDDYVVKKGDSLCYLFKVRDEDREKACEILSHKAEFDGGEEKTFFCFSKGYGGFNFLSGLDGEIKGEKDGMAKKKWGNPLTISLQDVETFSEALVNVEDAYAKDLSEKQIEELNGVISREIIRNGGCLAPNFNKRLDAERKNDLCSGYDETIALLNQQAEAWRKENEIISQFSQGSLSL